MTNEIAEISEWESEKSSMPRWLEVSLPWMMSFTLHIGTLLVVVALFYFSRVVKTTYDYAGNGDVISDPAVFDTPHFDAYRETGFAKPNAVNDNTDALQDKFTNVTNGWAQMDTGSQISSAFSGPDSGELTNVISLGAGGIPFAGAPSIGGGEGGKLAPYGIRGAGTPGPSKVFWCRFPSQSPIRIVYVLDHSGSMIDTFDFLRSEVKKSVDCLAPIQRFGVVMISQEVDAAFLAKDGQLVNATPNVKRDLKDFVDNLRAAGKNDDLYDPFAKGLEKALALKPHVIYFLTDGNFDPRLVDEAKRLNTGKCRINTIAFLKVSKEAEEALKTIAVDSGGKFKFVTDADLR